MGFYLSECEVQIPDPYLVKVTRNDVLCTEWLRVSNDAPTTQEFYAVCDRKYCFVHFIVFASKQD